MWQKSVQFDVEFYKFSSGVDPGNSSALVNQQPSLAETFCTSGIVTYKRISISSV